MFSCSIPSITPILTSLEYAVLRLDLVLESLVLPNPFIEIMLYHLFRYSEICYVQLKLQRIKICSLGRNIIIIVFDSSVTISKTTVDRFNIMTSLNFFGSSLGLWPGLGIFQIVECIIEKFVLKMDFNNVLKMKQ